MLLQRWAKTQQEIKMAQSKDCNYFQDIINFCKDSETTLQQF